MDFGLLQEGLGPHVNNRCWWRESAGLQVQGPLRSEYTVELGLYPGFELGFAFFGCRHFVHPRRLCTKNVLFRFFVLICSNGDDPGGFCFKFHRRPGFSAEATAIYIKGLTQFLPRTAAVKLFGQLVLALEGYDAIQTAVCAYIVVPVVNE